MTVNTLGSDPRLGGDAIASSKLRDSRTVAEWLWPFLAQGVALFSISALIYYHVHPGIEPGNLLQHAVVGLYDFVGLAPAVVFFLMVFSWSSIWLFTGILERPVVRVAKLVVMAVMLGVFFNLGSGGVAADTHTGSLGAWIANRLVVGIGYVPSIVLVWPTMFASVMLATDWFFTEWFERDRKTTDFEVGVEDAVTDHLRGLSSIANKPQVNVPEPERPAALGAEVTAATIEPAEFVPRTAVAEAPVVIEPLAPPVESASVREAPHPGAIDDSDVPPRPLSYAERRRVRAERRSTEQADETAPVAATPEPVEAASISEKRTHAPLVGKAELAALFGSDDDAAPVASEGSERISDESEITEDVPSEEARWQDSDHVEDDSAELEEEDAEADEDHEYEEESEEDSEEEEGDEYEAEEEDDEEVEEEYEDEEEDLEVDAELEDEYEEEDVEVDEDLEDEDLEDEDHEDEEIEDEELQEQAGEPLDIIASDADADADAAALEDASEAIEVAASTEADGSVVSIPRPEDVPPVSLPTPPAVGNVRDAAASKQQKLFASRVDEDLLLEAMDLVSSGRRTTATLLQRKLRIDYELAVEVLDELTNRGLLTGDEDRS